MKHKIFPSENSEPPTFWILPELHKLDQSCRRNPLETS